MMNARFPNGVEVRASHEVRAAAGRKLEGRVASFNVEARIGNFREVIRAGAFSKSLANGRDILLLADHDPARVLARTAAGNLKLHEDGAGLWFEATLPDTTAARDAWALVEARTAGGMSFGFRIPPGGDNWTGDLRELRNVDLIEASVISAHAAYSATSVAARAKITSNGDTARLRHLYLETL